MKESVISYSSSMVDKIRRKDPQLKAMTEAWERIFNGPVQVTIVDGRLTVKKGLSEQEQRDLDYLMKEKW